MSNKYCGDSINQIMNLTVRINILSDHLKQAKKDFASRRGLFQLLGKRERIIKYLSKKSSALFVQKLRKNMKKLKYKNARRENQ